jgi:hypothetical protein
MVILCFEIICISRSKKRVLSASGIISLASDIKNPADIGLESEATILPENCAIFSDLMVFIPAGPSAPGTRTVVVEILVKENVRDLGFTLGYYL